MGSKAKKLIISFGIFLIFLLVGIFTQKSMALYIGQLAPISGTPGRTEYGAFNLNSKDSKYFCIETGMPIDSGGDFPNANGGWYKVVSKVDITSDTQANFVMAYIAAQPNADMNHNKRQYSDKQKAIYAYFPDWQQTVGWSYPTNAGQYGDTSWITQGVNLYKNVQTAKSAHIEFADKNLDKIKTELYQYNGTEYVKVGPFQVNYSTFSGATISYTATNQNGSFVPLLFGMYDSNGQLGVYTSSTSVQSSGKQFYVLYDNKYNVTELNFKVELKGSYTEYYAEVCALTNSTLVIRDGQYVRQQNIIYVDGHPITKMVNDSDEITVPIKKDFDLEIEKKDADTGELLNNVGFVLYNVEKGQWVSGTSSTQTATYSSNREDAKVFITGVDGENGKIIAQNLVLGTYQVYETVNPNYGYEEITSDKLVLTISSSSGGTATYTVENEMKYGDLRIIKIDEDSESRLNNVGFVIYNVDKEQYVATASSTDEVLATYTSSRDEAKEFITGIDGEDGEIFVKGLEFGNYIIYETRNDNQGYEVIVEDKNVATLEFARDNNEFTLGNKRMYVNISGYVWEDIDWEVGKFYDSNNLYEAVNDDINDKLVSNITVRLKDRNGNTIKEAITNANGKYTFEDVLIDNLDEYYIEFSYNGMAYESVSIVDITNDRGTKAIEGNNRTSFNENFAQIAAGQSNNSDGIKTNDIMYNTEDYRSTINYEGDYLYGYSDAQIESVVRYTGVSVDDYKTYYPVNGVASKYLIESSTYNAYTSIENGNYSGYLSDIISAEDIRQNEIVEIGETFTEGINLGLKKRERPDLSVVKDLDSAKVSIVGAEHVYRYGDRFNEELWADNSNGVSGHDLDPQVKFEEKYAEMTYTRPLYASDVYYNGDAGEPLKVEVTYKISVRNTSTNLNATIYEIDDYFDSKYDVVAIGTQINEDGSIATGTEITTYTTPTDVNSEYKMMTIGGNNRILLELSPMEEGFIYVQLEVNRDDIVQIVEDTDTDSAKLDNISEIKKYGISKTNNGQQELYAGIDKDSQPGNVDVNDRTTWEDDTDRAPGLMLILQQAREVNGAVFLDEDENSLDTGKRVHTGTARQGNGQYDENEQGIENVKVTLVDPDGNVAQVYNEDTGTYEDGVTYTNENGEYTLEGFIPGEYQIQYTWGGNIDESGINSTYTLDTGDEQIVNVQNYKSTVVDETVWNAKETEDKWYHDSFKQNYPGLEWNTGTNTEIRASDAVDDYNTRLTIDSEIGDMTYSEKQKLENTYDETSTGDKYTNTQMNSNTQSFDVYIEFNDTENVEDNITDQTVQLTNTIESIDFGIIERARQILELDKEVTGVKITLANSNVIVNAQLVDGVLQGEAPYVTVMPPSNANNGQVKIEMDQEIIQGATIDIDYALKVTNISELEYQTQEFYMYGAGHGEIESALVTLQPSLIIDYIDNNMSTDAEDHENWTVVAQADRADYLYDENSNPDGLLSKDLETTLNSTIKVITTDQLKDNVLKPIGTESETSVTATLNAHKLLSNNDETFLENNAEIITVKRNNGGAIITPTPGNYEPSDSATSEEDDSVSPSVTVVPPTGLTTNTIAYVIIAISSLAIITAGIILIKKFVLK